MATTSRSPKTAAIVPPWLTLAAASLHSSLSKQTLRRLIDSGDLRAYRPVPGRLLVRTSELDELIERRLERRSEQDALVS